MPKLSAGFLLYRRRAGRGVEVLLIHPGGPIWARRDAGVWSIPKGEYLTDEDPLARAEVEFEEELGRPAPGGDRVDLGEVRQAGGKRVRAWALEGDLDVDSMTSNTFDMEWPRGSGVMRSFPEVDRAAWFLFDQARIKLVNGQLPLLDRLADALRADNETGPAPENDR